MSDSASTEHEPPISPDPPELAREVSPEAGDARDLAMAEPAATSGEPTTLAKLHSLPWSIAGNSFNTIFAQFTFFGSVFVLFLDTLGLSKSQIGLLLSLLPFTNVVALFVASAVARFGYKRTFLTTFGIRKVVTAFLLLTPWVVASYGSAAALIFVAAVVAIFALMRSIMEVAWIPWIQEFVPNSVRGKYAATDNVYATLAGIAAISVAGLVIGRSAGLTPYMVLIGAGVLFGLGALWCYSFLPGGAPASTDGTGRLQQHTLREAIHDTDYRRYLAGVSLITLATVPLASFLPLYLQEQVGIPSGQVVWVQVGTLAGALLSSYLWGWAADRYGSKPVMNSGVVLLAILPIFWWLVPKYATWSLYVALGVALLQGIANLGWIIGAGRLLFVSLVPPAKKVGYMALYSTWVGLVGGASQLAGGRILDLSQDLGGQFAFFTIDPYLPLFLMGILLAAASFPVLSGIRAELAVGVREFVAIFFRGNPFVAINSLIRYQLARDEHETVLMTEQLGKARSRLTVEELLEALSDPRFHVRYEAVITISRMRRDRRLTQALIQLLEGTELPLSIQAAWALGRIGDISAIEPLRKALDLPYRSIRIHTIRALGALNDTESIPNLMERLQTEPDRGLQMAYAAALGNLGAKEATGQLLSLLKDTRNEGARMELAYALARLVGKEYLFIRLLRQIRADAGTSAAQAMAVLKRRAGPRHWRKAPASELATLMDDCTNAFAREDLAQGVKLQSQIIRQLANDGLDESSRMILQECADRLDEFGATRIEYLVLALHTMNIAWTPAAHAGPKQ